MQCQALLSRVASGQSRNVRSRCVELWPASRGSSCPGVMSRLVSLGRVLPVEPGRSRSSLGVSRQGSPGEHSQVAPWSVEPVVVSLSESSCVWSRFASRVESCLVGCCHVGPVQSRVVLSC